MELEVVCVCRRPPDWVVALTADYARRLRRGAQLSFRYVAPGRDSLGAAERRRDEAQRVGKLLSSSAHVVALDGCGQEPDSPTLARWFEAWRNHARPVTLLIGGADGLDAGLLERAAQRWSLSALTLPHLFVQVLVAEQLYRAWTMLEGHPYHRG